MIYKSQLRSYRDLPLRWAEFGTVYRYEKTGELHGLTKSERFYCRMILICLLYRDQIKRELCNVIDLLQYVFRVMGFEDFTK